MWGRVWMSRFGRKWSGLKFYEEYLFGFETLVFATSGILSIHKQLVTLQRERKTWNSIWPLLKLSKFFYFQMLNQNFYFEVKPQGALKASLHNFWLKSYQNSWFISIKQNTTNVTFSGIAFASSSSLAEYLDVCGMCFYICWFSFLPVRGFPSRRGGPIAWKSFWKNRKQKQFIFIMCYKWTWTLVI